MTFEPLEVLRERARDALRRWPWLEVAEVLDRIELDLADYRMCCLDRIPFGYVRRFNRKLELL